MMRIALFSISTAVLISACGGAAAPNERVVSASAAVRGAEVGGANSDPQAALLLKHAKDELAKAKGLMNDGDNQKASWVLQRAEADAELALEMAREATAKAEAQSAIDRVRKLKQGAQP